MQNFLTLLFILVLQYSTTAQIIIQGKVTDDKGYILSNANITYGKKELVVANVEGNFSCTVKTLPVLLSIHYIGHETKKIIADSTNYKNLIIVMSRKNHTETEIIVVGYNTMRRSSDMVSSSTSISAEEISAIPRADFKTSVSGKASALGVSSSMGCSTAKVLASALIAKSESAKLLTASEIDDFKKWNLWNDYQQLDFKRFSEEYTINYTKRYAVQLVNKNKNALVNVLVQLQVKATGAILWQSKTDNTGKAELWNTNDSLGKKEKLVLLVDGKTEYPISNFDAGVNIILYNEPCNISDKVDIAFIVDATGSMGDEINYLKAELDDIIVQLKKRHQTTDFAIASVFYRDYGDNYVTKVSPFTNAINSITGFIQQQVADGGGDYPEAVVSALTVGIDSLQWRGDAKARITFLILDAPPHDDEMEKYKALIKQYAAKGIRVIPIVCSGAAKSVEFLMRSFALATNGIYTFLTDDSGIGDKHLKPTTDAYTVQSLNQLMISLINQMIYTNPCTVDKKAKKQENPFTVKANDILKVTVFPNPTKGYCTMESNTSIKELFIADFTGKLLQKINIPNEDMDITIDLSKYPSGTYIIKYITDEDKTGACKVVKL
jgi:Secretion system C-terminal sorting domain/von Willebrand factor type A domain